MLEQISMYTIYDRVAEESAPPFCAKNDAVARRMFKDLLNSMATENIDDFELYYVGYYDFKVMDVVGNGVPNLVDLEVIS